ncbi:hypothetical protein Q9189_006944 [Teloschistes chrysophthalmus]
MGLLITTYHESELHFQRCPFATLMDAPPKFDVHGDDATLCDSESNRSCGDLSQSSTWTEHTTQRDIRYTDLTKLPIRRRHLVSDMNALGIQFVATMEILKRNIIQRTLRRDRFSKGLRQRHRVMHVHTSPDTSILELYSSLAREMPGFSCSILSIFPVMPGTWELIVKTSCLENLIYACKFALAVKIAEPPNLPPGMVARTAQLSTTRDWQGIERAKAIQDNGICSRPKLGGVSWGSAPTNVGATPTTTRRKVEKSPQQRANPRQEKKSEEGLHRMPTLEKENNKRQCSFESHDLLDHLASTYIPVSNTWAASRPNMAYHPSEAHDSKQPNYALQAQYQVVSQNLGPMSFLQYPVPGNVPVEILTEPPNEIRPLYFIADGPSILSFQPVTHSYGEKVIRWSNGEAPSKEFYGDSAAGKTQHLCDARQVGQTERIRVTAQKESVVMPYPALEEDPTVESSWSRSPGLKYDGWDQGGCIPSGEPEPRNLHSAWHRTQDTPMYNIDPLLTECDPFMGRPQVDQSGSFLGMTTLG